MPQIRIGKTFAALPGERAALEEIIAVDEATIDAEYLADFRLLKEQITTYLQATTPEKNSYLTLPSGIVSKLI